MQIFSSGVREAGRALLERPPAGEPDELSPVPPAGVRRIVLPQPEQMSFLPLKTGESS